MKRVLLILASLLLAALGVKGLVVQGYDPAVNDRFSSGFPDAPVPNESPKFIGKGLDWSGVGWKNTDPRFSVALLSSRNFAYSKHASPEIGGPITFLGGDGHLHQFHVAKLQPVEIGKNGTNSIFSDTGVGTFEETVALSYQMAHYPVVFSKKGIEPFIGKRILTYGKLARVGTNEIVEGIMLKGMASEYNFNTRGLSAGMGTSEVGDSGSPAFIVLGGKLALVGTHWRIDTDSMVSGIIPAMNALMAEDGGKLEVISLGH